MAGLGQIAFLGGGGLSGLMAAMLAGTVGLPATFALLGAGGVGLGVVELARHGRLRLAIR
jgi:Zn-dependent alcohol dehydrogenase